ncbi:ABC transporter permease [Microbacterium ulmi]|uniref:Iron ABC transporter permease n=1 Tax=Microbacterium ulmi TaxID=179095 RepID=A0A7Y2LYT3_9MICO|nr:iron ABC transporter permease [Microbacterium ulmi]NII70299.1 iron(III) transport system permease protein [Microbacterium ulmi]NNH03346.1 iron ABC transporter permease [Microbacterium ulmi]
MTASTPSPWEIADAVPVRGRRKSRGTGPSIFTPIVIAASAVIAFLVLLPAARIVQSGVTEMGWSGLVRLVTRPYFGQLMGETAIVVVSSSVLAIVVATLLAWLNERTDATMGVAGDLLPLVPLFLPSVAMAIGWVMLAAPDAGFINGALSLLPGSPQVDIYSYPGLIFVYVLVLVPYAYLPISAAFRALDLSREEAARVCGAGNVRVFFTVALRSVAPAIASSLVLVVIVAFAMYSIPTVIATRARIDIVAVSIVEAVTQTYPIDYSTALGLSLIMFAILFALWLLQQRVLGQGRFARVGDRTEGASLTRLGGWRWVARGMMILYILCAAVLPVAALVVVSFQRFWTPDFANAIWGFENYVKVFNDQVGMKALVNSLQLGVTAAAATIVAALLIIIFKQRNPHGILQRIVDGVSKLPAVVSHIVLGIGIVLAFAGPPFRLGSTVWIILLAYLLTYLPYAMLTLEGSRAQISDSLTEAAQVSGAWDWRAVRTVVLPLMVPGIASAGALLFVLMTGDLSLAVLLSTPRTPVMGLIVLDYWGQGTIPSVATISVIMTVISAIVVGVLQFLGRPRYLHKR